MPYPRQVLEELERQYNSVTRDLQELQLSCVRSSEGIENPDVVEHLTHRVGRSINVLE